MAIPTTPVISGGRNQDEFFPRDTNFENPTGLRRVFLPNGSSRTRRHPFFKPLRANDRARITCHSPSNAMSLSVGNIRRRSTETASTDPLFAAIDGSNCPSLPPAQPAFHSLLLDHGLLRASLPWPPKNITPDFRLQVLSRPAGCEQPSARSPHTSPGSPPRTLRRCAHA
ncbi:MAG: hypothetical protein ACK5TN_16865 [Acidobacteriota bacterium]